MIDGLEADVVTLALAYDIDAHRRARRSCCRRTGRSACRDNSAPYTSTIVFLVRKGNPKGIKDWDDLVKPGVAGDHAEPEDLGRRALELPRRVGLRAASRPAATRPRRKEFVDAALQERAGARLGRARRDHHLRRSAASATCCSPGRTRRCSRSRSSGADKFEIVVPSRQHPGRAAGRAWSTRSSTSTARARSPQAYLEYLYTPEGQEIAAKHYYRPRDRGGGRRSTRRSSRRSTLFTIDEVFGGWQKAQKTHFADGGVFDQIYQPRQVSSRAAIAAIRVARRGAACCPGFGLTLGLHARSTSA